MSYGVNCYVQFSAEEEIVYFHNVHLSSGTQPINIIIDSIPRDKVVEL
jgi:hypothetical protein